MASPNSTSPVNLSVVGLNDSICNTARVIAKTTGFNIILFLEIILGVAASLPNFFLMCTIWHVTVFHNNLRLCLAHFSFVLLWCSFGYFVKAATLLPIVLNGDPCSLATHIQECKLRELALGIPAQALVYAGMAVALERLYSTLRYKRYDEQAQQKPYLGVFLIFFAYIVPIANTVNGVLAVTKTDSLLPICENTLSATPTSASTSIIVNLMAMAICILIVGAIWRINDTKLRTMMANRANCTLSARFQIEQNVQVNRIIVPSTALQMICFIPNYLFLFLILVGLPLTYEVKIILIHCNYVWKQLYAIMHPIVCFARHPKIRKELYKSAQWVQTLVTKADLSTTNGQGNESRRPSAQVARLRGEAQARLRREAQAHFQMLTNAWNAK